MKTQSLLWIFLFSIASLFAGVEEHLKRNFDKSDAVPYQMQNIDFIYMINLDQRPEKYQSCIDRLGPFGIFPFRFSAVNGWELTCDDINDLGVTFDPATMQSGTMGTSYLPENNGEPYHEVVSEPGRVYFCHCMARGPIGIVLSHLSVLQDAYDSGYETIWVMEDDIEVVKNPHLLSTMIDRLDGLVGKEGWDVLFTDPDTKDNNGRYVPCLAYAWRPNFVPANPSRFAVQQQISPDFKKNGARYGAYSMIVRRSGMKKILDFIKTYKIFLPYDMDFCMPNDINFYSMNYDIISTQPNALSDNGGANYKNKTK